MGCGASVEQHADPEAKIEEERRINAAQAKARLEQQVRANLTSRNRRAAYANVARSGETDITTLTLALARAGSNFDALPKENSSESLVKTYEKSSWSENRRLWG